MTDMASGKGMEADHRKAFLSINVQILLFQEVKNQWSGLTPLLWVYPDTKLPKLSIALNQTNDV